MLGRTYDTQVCSIARSLEQIGERWSLLIVRDALFAGVTRFGDFQHNLGIATNEKGRALAVALIALSEWGDEFASPIDPPILYRHTECDGAVHAVAACETCGPVPPGEVAVRIGPGMPAEYLASRRRRASAS